MYRTRTTKGFTIVELAIATPIVVIVMVTLMGFLIALLTDFSNQRLKQNLNITSQTALEQIESDVKLSSQFLDSTDTARFKDAYGKNLYKTNAGVTWDFAGTGATSRVLILSTYSTTQNPVQSNRAPVYLSANGCTGDLLYSNDVLQNTTLYFVRNQTLYRRVLTDITTPTCPPSQFQVQSCPPSSVVTDGARYSSSTGACVTDDIELLKNVSNFSINYFIDSDDDPTLPASVYTDNSILSDTVSADITIGHSDPSKPNITNTVKLRVTRLN